MVTERTSKEIIERYNKLYGFDGRNEFWVLKDDLIKAQDEIVCIIEQLTAETILHEERILKIDKRILRLEKYL